MFIKNFIPDAQFSRLEDKYTRKHAYLIQHFDSMYRPTMPQERDCQLRSVAHLVIYEVICKDFSVWLKLSNAYLSFLKLKV